jgi:pimeloyl-ACP methyl ester carboxylesterase
MVIMHGLGGKGEGWIDAGLTGFLEERGLRYGGTIRSEEGEVVVVEGGTVSPPESDFFHLEMSDPFQSLDRWSEEIRAGVNAVLERTGAPRVVLVGFSAGGVAGRKYVVDYPEDHGVARLVTLASPHLGSEWAYFAKVDEALERAIAEGGLGSVPARGLDSGLGVLEDLVGIPLDAPLVRELVPEEHNEMLQALNRSEHPWNLEYACIRTAGSPGFRGWNEVETDLVRLREGEVLDSKIVQKLSTVVLSAAAFLQNRPSFRGDGAVLLSSQDLREVEYFRTHPDLADAVIDETTTIDAGHMGAKERYRAVLEGIASEVRFLDVRATSDSSSESTRLELDFHDYFAGVLNVTAEDPDSGNRIPVGRPALYRRGDESFARVTIGPFDRETVPVVDVRVESLEHQKRAGGPDDRPVVYGKRLIVGDVIEGREPEPSPLEPVILEIDALRNIPESTPQGEPWDGNGTGPDLQLVLFAGEEEMGRSELYRDVVGTRLEVGRTFELPVDPSETRIKLEVREADPPAPALVGRVIWNPGQLRSGVVTETTDEGLAIDLKISAPEPEHVTWDPQPFYVSH